MAGDAETGVSIMRVTAGLDSGPVALRQAEPIHPDDTLRHARAATGAPRRRAARARARRVAAGAGGAGRRRRDLRREDRRRRPHARPRPPGRTSWSESSGRCIRTSARASRCPAEKRCACTRPRPPRPGRRRGSWPRARGACCGAAPGERSSSGWSQPPGRRPMDASRLPARASSVSATPARRVAHAVLRRTFEDGAYTDRAFTSEAGRAGLEGRERAFAMRLAYGAVQRRDTLDHVIGRLAGRPPHELDAPVLDALRLGVFAAAASSTGWPTTPPSASRWSWPSAAGPARGLVNAVLRRAAREARRARRRARRHDARGGGAAPLAPGVAGRAVVGAPSEPTPPAR